MTISTHSRLVQRIFSSSFRGNRLSFLSSRRAGASHLRSWLRLPLVRDTRAGGEAELHEFHVRALALCESSLSSCSFQPTTNLMNLPRRVCLRPGQASVADIRCATDCRASSINPAAAALRRSFFSCEALPLLLGRRPDCCSPIRLPGCDEWTTDSYDERWRAHVRVDQGAGRVAAVQIDLTAAATLCRPIAKCRNVAGVVAPSPPALQPFSGGVWGLIFLSLSVAAVLMVVFETADVRKPPHPQSSSVLLPSAAILLRAPPHKLSVHHPSQRLSFLRALPHRLSPRAPRSRTPSSATRITLCP